ncbi:MAG: 2Fe-2S iron-sulfur cluster-binding protein [Candidatus Dormibacterales bacterium]
MERLAAAPGEVIDRDKAVSFVLDGRPVTAYEGDTVASAMAAANVIVTTRSFKYHRPRGLMCMTGNCASCMVRIDGVPNLRACQTPVREGMQVKRQNGMPSVDFDLMRFVDRFSAFFPPGFYYKSFYRPRFMWPLAEPFIRRAAGIGEPPDEGTAHKHYDSLTLHPDVLVVGGGPAGLGAALEAARAGARTVLIESEPALGGRLRGAWWQVRDPETGRAETGHDLTARLAAELPDAGVDVRLSSNVFGIFEHNLVAAATPDGLLRLRPGRIVIATGALEQPLVFGNNDLPGVMLAGGADRLIGLYRVLPGRSAVVLTGDERGYRTARALAGGGASVTILDWRAKPPSAETATDGVEVHTGAAPVRAEGGKRVSALVASVGGTERRFSCDLVVMAGPAVPASGLLAQSGARMRYDETLEIFAPGELPEGILVAGAVTGGLDPGRNLVAGRRAGVASAGPGRGAARAKALAKLAAEGDAPKPEGPPHTRTESKTFTCLCMDVTTKEMKGAVAEGFDSIELLKRYTTLGMGPCQGKSCLAGCVRHAAELTGRSVPETGVPTARAPWRPVELGLLAADHAEPRKESPLHDCHVDLGAEFTWAGEWRRPRQYRDPAEECRAVHERVGVIDVSTLGKLRLRGAGAVDLLERLYPNRFGDLKVGRIRYGAMLNDQGVILDDGTVGRLAEDEFFVTTTTSGADAIDQWIKWWMADWRLPVQVVNVSSAYAAINVAGPRSRELMTRLTDADMSPAALPYLKLAHAAVAGAPALILRIGFVGELSYELHFPSAFAVHVWESILHAGEDLGVLPFGLETQRILRLEKQHIIVGQDTDALSTPYGAGLDWMVKLDKKDFLGRAALEEDAASGAQEKLVGFVVDAGGLPAEGSALVGDGMPVGRVCSSRWSDTARSFIGLAWVPVGMAQEGTRLDFRSNGSHVIARVHTKPFYDPDGARLRS